MIGRISLGMHDGERVWTRHDYMPDEIVERVASGGVQVIGPQTSAAHQAGNAGAGCGGPLSDRQRAAGS